jgi:hypothetical protein
MFIVFSLMENISICGPSESRVNLEPGTLQSNDAFLTDENLPQQLKRVRLAKVMHVSSSSPLPSRGRSWAPYNTTTGSVRFPTNGPSGRI